MKIRGNILMLVLFCFAVLTVSLCPRRAVAAEVPSFTVGWSVYAGWNPYFYMQKSGILKKWADKYGIVIKVQRFDYAASLDSFVAKNIDGCTMTNMEALDMPAAAGVDSTAIIMGDYSNGNDAVLVRNGLTFDKLSGPPVMLVQKTVSEYLLERGMVLNGQQAQLSKLRLINTSDSDIVPAFMNNASNQAAVTWKPLVSQILADKSVHSIFDSSKIPGEILDLLVVRTEVLNRPDGSGVKFAKAITGAWYETLQKLTVSGPAQAQALKISAAASGDSVDSYKEQLKTTYLYSDPKAATEFTVSGMLKQKMDLVRQFCFKHGLLGKNIKSVDDVGIAYPDGSVQGRKDSVRLRFNPTYMQAAQQGKL
jgi:NitT/TauT family transport system substrate-binding protein